jgi:hypothetical protein
VYSVKDKGGKPGRKPHPPPHGSRNLKSENSQDYAQKTQRNFMFMNSASARVASGTNMEINGSRKISLYGF